MSLPKAFADELLRSLDSGESIDPGRFLTVGEIREIADHLATPFPENLSIIDVINDLLNKGWIETDHGGSVDTALYRISAKGQIRAAASVNYVDHFNEAMSAIPDLESDDSQVAEDKVLDSSQSDEPIRVDTTDWTGLAKAVSPQNLRAIRDQSKALQLAIMQSDADIQTKTDACKRVEAVIVLLEAPNVPWREVVNLLNHPTVTAFFAAVSLIQFIIGLAA